MNAFEICWLVITFILGWIIAGDVDKLRDRVKELEEKLKNK